LRPFVLEPASASPPAWQQVADTIDMVRLRAHIHAGRKVRLHYRDEAGRETVRVVWPVTVGYWDTVRLIIAWCELRADFRSFRTDRVASADFLLERYPERPQVLRAKWRKALETRRARERTRDEHSDRATQ
jgi:predicted DNA-binding transcriptional regulator YafY